LSSAVVSSIMAGSADPREEDVVNRMAVIVGIAALVVGLLAGFLWWGMPTERLQGQLTDARRQAQALERRADEAEAKLRAAQDDTKAVEGDLARERERRSRLEVIISEGRK
jgi:CHASE1-domain containing sensor protein